MRPFGRVGSLALLLSAVVVISDASAQFGGGRSGGDRAGRGGDGPARSGASRNERQAAPQDADSYERIEYRLSLLQEDLKLGSEQVDVWQSFAVTVRAYAGDLARERARMTQTSYANPAQTSGLQHIGQAVDAAQNRLTALQDVESSAKVLYRTLTPEQKTLADMRIPTIIAPRPTRPGGNSSGSDLPSPGSGSAQSR